MSVSRYTIVSAGENPETVFSLERASDLTGLHPEMILEFTRAELVHVLELERTEDPCFNEVGIARLRQIEILRRRESMSLRTLRYILRLQDRLENAECELRQLRERMR